MPWWLVVGHILTVAIIVSSESPASLAVSVIWAAMIGSKVRERRIEAQLLMVNGRVINRHTFNGYPLRDALAVAGFVPFSLGIAAILTKAWPTFRSGPVLIVVLLVFASAAI